LNQTTGSIALVAAQKQERNNIRNLGLSDVQAFEPEKQPREVVRSIRF
jgi:hypothetical protein